MKVENCLRCLLILSCITLLLVVYWRTYTDRIPLQSFEILDNTITALKEPSKQCNEGHYFSQMDNTCIVCEKGSFSLKGWIGCLPWLDCKSIERDVRPRRLLSNPSSINAVKHIFLADWHGYDVVYVKCAHEMFWEDCQNNAEMLQEFQGSGLVAQLIGKCEEKHEVKYHRKMWYKRLTIGQSQGIN